jgi:hypothetical protein
MMPALIWRIFDEETLLTKDLPGYAEYRNTVRSRIGARVVREISRDSLVAAHTRGG